MPQKLIDFCLFYIRKHWEKFLLILLFEILASMLMPTVSYFAKLIIDKIYNTQIAFEFSIVSTEFYYFAALILCAVLLNRMSGFTNMFTIPVIRVEIRKDAFKYTMEHSHKFFVDNLSGAIGHRINDLSAGFSRVISTVLFAFVPIISTISISIYLLSISNQIFAFITLIWIVVYFSTSFYLARNMKLKSKDYARAQALVSGRIIDTITNIFNVRNFANIDKETTYLDKFLGDERDANKKMFLFLELYRLSQGLFNAMLLIGLMFLSIKSYQEKIISIGDFVLIYSLSFTLISNIEKVSYNLLDIFEISGTFKNAVELLGQPINIKDISGAKKLNIQKGEIVFKNVSFAYDSESQVFKDLNIHIKAGEKIGLVGYSGSGKTTFINLLLRLYELDKGEISVDNQNIAEVTQESLRNSIAIIPQDPMLFNRTLRENIAYSQQKNAPDEAVKKATKNAKADEFIQQLEKGYDSIVGERGVKLSGGQRQRVAIARALLKDAPILIMDEATSSLDSVTEKGINESMKEIIANRTVIIIAHRLSTISHLDRIIVFDQGKIIETGSHAELIKLGGTYAKMWKMQSGGFLPT
jgi:ATP-binding cassette, subfamily B, bacterial